MFRREQYDIHVTVPISVTMAMLGGSVTVPTLKGTTTLTVKPGTQPDEVARLSSQGIKHVNRSSYGDQFVHLKIQIPK